MENTTINIKMHQHNFSGSSDHEEKKTWIVIAITAIMMVVEIFGGIIFGSMALLADGWHMGTHVAAFGITIFAYRYARKHALSSKFTFGTGKVSVLGGFASSVALAVVALVMAIESIHRLIEPQTIQFNQAIIIAFIGLVVNGICAVILHSSSHSHHHHDHHHDHNLRAAYMHVIADALTSILAIVGLFFAKYLNWVFMDAIMGIVGALVITKWAYGLLKETSPILLDAADEELSKKIKNIIEADSDNRIVDFHLWYLESNKLSVILSIITNHPKETEHYQNLLKEISEISHITIELKK